MIWLLMLASIDISGFLSRPVSQSREDPRIIVCILQETLINVRKDQNFQFSCHLLGS